MSLIKSLIYGMTGQRKKESPDKEFDDDRTESDYVLSDTLTDMRTSLFDSGDIRRLISGRNKGGRIDLERCKELPTELGLCFMIRHEYVEKHGNNGDTVYSGYETSIHFETDKELERYVTRDLPPEKVADIFCAFLERSELPNLKDWDRQYRIDTPAEREPCSLIVDGEEFPRIDLNDVIAAIEQLERGESESVMLYTPSGANGYIEVTGKLDDYSVEISGDNSRGERVGFRTDTRYGGHVRQWMTEYFIDLQFPRITDAWEEFDVDASFQ